MAERKLTNKVSHYMCSICGKRVKSGEDVYQFDHGYRRGRFTVHAACLVELSAEYQSIQQEEPHGD